jgi:hypothetical protein
MISTRLFLSVALLTAVVAMPVQAGPVSHALQVTPEGAVLFVDLEQNRLLRYHEGELSVASDLEGVPAGDHLQNLVLTLDGELYLGERKTVWKIDSNGGAEIAKPPKALKSLFGGRPGDLGRDGSVYVARDYKNIERSMPGGDSLPVLVTDNISKIHSLAVTPYGRIFFGNTSEVAKLESDGSVKIFVELAGDRVLGLAAIGENRFLLLRQDKNGARSLEIIDPFGNSQVLVNSNQIASVTDAGPLAITNAD